MSAPTRVEDLPSRPDPLHLLVPLRRPRVLLVDDDRDLVPVFRRVLRGLDPDAEVDWAGSVRTALHRLTDADYDLVVADFLLEDGTGLALERFVHARDPEAGFAMISSAPVRWEIECRARADVPFLPKPFTPADLAGFLAELLPLR